MDITILVATHKPYTMPQESIYIPFYDGPEENNIAHYEDGRIGDNIAGQNDRFCELTRAYWAWKNLDSDVIGLCQYRRYFKKRYCICFSKNVVDRIKCVLDKDSIKEALKNKDIILPKKRFLVIESVKSHYIHAHGLNEFQILQSVIQQVAPQSIKSFNEVMKSHSAHFNNMFIMPQKLFNEYCSWLFPILFQMERKINFSKYNNQQTRILGYTAERLLDVWIKNKNLTYAEYPILYTEKQKFLIKLYGFLKRKYVKRKNVYGDIA